MPKDSETYCLLDNSLQATISHKSVSSSPSLLNPSFSLSFSLSQLVCPPLESPPVPPVRIVPVLACQAAASLMAEPRIQD